MLVWNGCVVFVCRLSIEEGGNPVRTLDEAIQARKAEREELAKRQAMQRQIEDVAQLEREQKASNLVADHLAAEYDIEWPDSFRFVTTECEKGKFYLTIRPKSRSGHVDLNGAYLQVIQGKLIFSSNRRDKQIYWRAVGKDNYHCDYDNLLDAIMYILGDK